LIWIVLIVAVVLLLLGPAWWVKHTLKKHGEDNSDLPGTGGELAEHLAARFKLELTVEETQQGDHYDPVDRAIRLEPRHFSGRSLSAVAVAAHEFGHALQHATGFRPLLWRTRLAKVALILQQLGAIAFLLAPFSALITRSPIITGMLILVGLSNMLFSVLMHFITLPVEWDASFKRALPLLRDGEYLDEAQIKCAEQVLTAAALTYVSAALKGILSVGQWWGLVRRLI